jgi:predicted transposase YdaD
MEKHKTEKNYMSRKIVRRHNKAKVNHTYKARLFETIFSKKEELLQLYNAIHKTSYDDPELLTINTLENVIYLSMKNDLSFLIGSDFHLYEHQSTYNPNMPFRFLEYVATSYSKMVDSKNQTIYGRKAISLPTPHFIVFYNGEEEHADEETLRLSDLFETKEESPSLELVATMLNINLSHNQELLDSCKILKDYASYIAKVREYLHVGMEIDEATEKAIDDCIREDILSDFLRDNRAEVMYMTIFEYDEEATLKAIGEQEYADGYEHGHLAGQQQKLIQQVTKKLQRNQSIEQIAEDLCEEVEVIESLVRELEQDK